MLREWTDARVPQASGAIADHLSGVADAFAQNFENGEELGACFSAVIDGEMIVDIRGGYADRKKTQAWNEGTLACIYSTGKAVLTLLIAREVSNGRLDYDAPVAAYWPEFAANGKEEITVAQALSHQGGLCGFADEMPPADWIEWDVIVERLAAIAPLWAPGSASGYHPQTFGFIAGELLRRVTGLTVKQHIQWYQTQIFCGMGASEMARAAVMPKPPRAPDLGALTDLKYIAFLKPWSAAARVDRDLWMAAEIPASNMHADARSLARILQPFVNGGYWDGDPHLDESAIAAAFKERIRGDDLVLPFDLSWSAGVMRNTNGHFGPNPNAYGHAGFGGSCVVIDPARKLTAAYVMNKMSPYLVGDPRALNLVNALYAAIDD